jgi:asparagine synthase (glutamine-hydrolysing)
MCGILYTRGFNLSSNKEALLSIKHRGPDADGYVQVKKNFLGHVRLSIIDLNPRSNQPFKGENGDILIFNGEIYNHKEIKIILENQYKVKFNTESDTEVLFWIIKLKLWNLFEKMNGMWAFVFLDEDKNIYFSRDRFGIKPMFLYHCKDEFVISSEVAAFKVLLDLKIDKKTIKNFIYRPSSVLGVNSFYEKVNDLECGILFKLNIDNKVSKVFELKKYNKQTKIRSTIIDSINLRRDCDVNVGLTLSSGLDSNIIANVLSKSVSNNGMNTFTVSTGEIDSFESDVASKVSNIYGFNHNEIKLQSEKYIDNLSTTIAILGRPHSSYAITSARLMYEKIAEKKIKVLIEGQGADERFGGYRIIEYPKIIFSLIKKFKFYKAFRVFRDSKVDFIYLLKYLLDNTTFIFGLIYSFRMRKFIKLDYGSIKYLKKSNSSPDKNLQNLLFYSDHLSMNYGVEVRNPFMDYRFENIKAKEHNKYTKVLLRENFSNIDEDLGFDLVWNTNKLGFYTPMLEIFKQNIIQIKELFESFKKRDLIKLTGNFDFNNINKEEETRLVYRIISTELWLRNL